MNDLVFIDAGLPVTSSKTIADNTSNNHASIIKLIRKYVSDFEYFGRVDFKSIRQERGGHPIEYAILNEQQATLLLTYLRNSDIVREFKKRLVAAFYELRNQGQAKQVDPDEFSAVELIHAADALANALRLEGSSRILAISKVVRKHVPQLESMFPDAGIDAPIKDGKIIDTSAWPSDNLTNLLGIYDIDIKPVHFNYILEKAGILEKRVRQTVKGDLVHYWSVTQKGLEYGKNVICVGAPRETKPHWYVGKFEELIIAADKCLYPDSFLLGKKGSKLCV